MTASRNLLADVGGTNTRVAMAVDGLADPQSIQRFRNDDFESLRDVLAHYLTTTNENAPDFGCIAVAGPVSGGEGELTNIDWRIRDVELSQFLNAKRVFVLNDLEAQGHALSNLPESAIKLLRSGQTPANDLQNRLVVGIGTGFNAAPVIHTDHGLVVPPSECGHITLPTPAEIDRELADYLTDLLGFASVEDVLSGRGLEALYSWNGLQAEGPQLSGHEITMALSADGNKRVAAAAEIFVRIMGSTIGNLALVHLPFGGIFLVGGVARAFAPHLQKYGFDKAMRDKGRFADLIDAFSVSLVEDDFAALRGCAVYLTATIKN